MPLAGAVLGGVVLAVADALPYVPGASIDHLVTTSQSSWGVAPLFALPPLAAVGAVLGAFAPFRAVGAGILVATGAAGYLLHLQELGFSVTVGGTLTPRPGMLLGLLGSAVVLAAGMLSWGRSAASPGTPRRLLAVRLAVATGAVATLAATLVPYENVDGNAFAILYRPVLGDPSRYVLSLKWYALAPVGIAVLMLGIALALRNLDVHAAAGALLAAGALGSLSYVYYSFALEGGANVGAGGYLGFGGCALAMLAAVPLLVSSHATTGVEEESADRARPGANARTAATRYLCAAAHLDDTFARDAIRRVVDEDYRAVAPSFGIDLGTALRHCFAARRRKRIRDAILAALVVPAILLLVYRHTAAGVGVLLLALVLAWLVVFTELWISRYRIVASRLSRGAYDPSAAPRLTEEQERKIAALEAAERGNVTVYSGFRPFVGSGWDHGGWSFALNVGKGKKPAFGDGERLAPESFQVEELYDAVQRDVQALELEDLLVEDRLYVDGQRIRDDERFVPSALARPRSELSPEELRAFVRSPERTNRVYRCIRIHGWEGEFVLSIFLNFARAGRSLFAEARYFLLAPFQDEYLAVDRLEPRPTVGQRLRVARQAIPQTAALLIVALPRLLGELRAAVRGWRARRLARRLISTDPSFDYGATTSIRELAQSTGYRRYFQQLDREMAGKIVERQILDSIIRFLDARNIDTSEIEERQTAILNNGVLMSGGTLKAESLAVGTGARARVARVVNPTKTSAGGGGASK